MACTRKLKNACELMSIGTGLVLVLVTCQLWHNFSLANQVKVEWIELIPGLTLSLSLTPLGLLFALAASTLWLTTALYAIGYLRALQEHSQTRFYQFFALAMTAVMGIAFADNLLTLYVFYELLTLTTFPLVVHSGKETAVRGGRVYFAFLLFTSVLFFLLAIVGTWFIGGSLDFTPGGLLNRPIMNTGALSAASLLLPLFVLGIGKAAVFPFYQWLPAAMVAPTPVSALLHAVAVVKGGVFTLLKVCLYIFGTDVLVELPSQQFMLYLAGFSILFASFMALQQDNLKKRLAYSTISQLGYISMGALLANGSAILGASMHLVVHAFGKIILFFCAGAILVATNKTLISDMTGLGRQMPFTMVAFFIGSLTIIGLPPAAGLWSKWYLLQGAMTAEQWLLILVLAFSSILNIFYLLPIPIRAFFSPAAAITVKPPVNRVPTSMVLSIAFSSTVCLVLFFLPESLFQLAQAILIRSGQ